MKKLFLFTLFFSFVLFAQVPNTMSYSGKLTTPAGVAINGFHNLEFKIFDIDTGGTALWHEYHSNVPIDHGLFSVTLGQAFPINLDFSEQYWIEIEVDSVVLSPRAELTSSPYSFRSLYADSVSDSDWNIIGDDMYAITDGNVGIGTTNPNAKLHIKENDTLNAFKITIRDTTQFIVKNNGKVGIGIGTPLARLDVGYSSTDTGNVFRVHDGGTVRLIVTEDGKVGIGTETPEAKLHIYRGSSGETATDVNGLFIENSGTSNSAYVFQTATAGAGKSFSITNGGRIGIGTDSPAYNVHLVGGSSLATMCIVPDTDTSGDGGAKILLGEDREFYRGMGIKYDGTDNYLFVYGKNGSDIYSNLLTIKRESGRVGIGTNSADAKLDIRGGSDYDPLLAMSSGQTRLIVKNNGRVGIGTSDPQAQLDVRDKIVVTNSSGDLLVEIGSGLDYAEGFDVTDSDKLKKGMVVVIDPNNPGKLKISHLPYDHKVAGIIAGAKSLGSGIKLGSEQFDHNVALAGRVYCYVDATEEGIEPGDLLTTSSTPGYAMKVKDYERAKGSILGKAMEKLEKGKKGKSLVLVTLQ